MYLLAQVRQQRDSLVSYHDEKLRIEEAQKVAMEEDDDIATSSLTQIESRCGWEGGREGRGGRGEEGGRGGREGRGGRGRGEEGGRGRREEEEGRGRGREGEEGGRGGRRRREGERREGGERREEEGGERREREEGGERREREEGGGEEEGGRRREGERREGRGGRGRKERREEEGREGRGGRGIGRRVIDDTSMVVRMSCRIRGRGFDPAFGLFSLLFFPFLLSLLVSFLSPSFLFFLHAHSATSMLKRIFLVNSLICFPVQYLRPC